MARFRSVGAMVIGSRKYPAGTVFCDWPSGIPGDVVYVGPGNLTAKNVGPNLFPIDEAARGMVAASRFAYDEVWLACGASSVE